MTRCEKAAALLLLVVSTAVPAHALKTERLATARTASGAAVEAEVVSGRAFVRFTADATADARSAALAGIGASINQEFPKLGWTSVRLPAGLNVATALTQLRGLPKVLDAQADFAHRVSRAPNDPLVNSQYQFSQVDAFGAWEYEIGDSSRVTIAVIDAGIEGTHPDLSAKMSGLAHQFCDPGPDKVVNGDDLACVTAAATAACDHATRVAGVAAASSDNGVQVAGMSWGARLLSLKVFRDPDCTTDCSDAAGACATDDQAIANALNFTISKQNTEPYGRIVVNMSLGGPPPCGGVVQAAVTDANNAGIVVIAAAGNDGSDVNSPGDCAGVIPMGATDVNNDVAGFSSRGPRLASNGLVAPGVSLVTTDVGGKTANATGTSFSSPMGAGLAALVLSARPSATPAQVQTWMRAGAQDIGRPSSVQGAGRMNAYRTMRLAVKGTLAGFDGEQKVISFPNPFRLDRSPMVSFAIPPSLAGSGFALKIYTLDGGFVRELKDPAWDGKNADGTTVASGTYVFVVKTDKGSARGRMTVIR